MSVSPTPTATTGVDGVILHRLRTMSATIGAGIPRAHPAEAAIHAAQWASSDRQAALLLCLVIQQRLTRPIDLVRAWQDVQRSRRRAFIAAVVA